MHAFTRLTSFLLFVLSLSFLTCALPTPAAVGSKELAVRTADCGPKVLDIVLNLRAQVEADVAAIAKAEVLADVQVAVGILLKHIYAAADATLAVGVKVDIEAKVKAKIVVEVALCITLIVKACIALVLKFGLLAVLAVLASIDVAIKALLVNLQICIAGIITLIVQAIVDVKVVAFIKVHLLLCVDVLGLLKL
ncbi:hypothetical protein FRC07_006593 [Ceratobasidium sp. 392]|nr:hypothetical protein FRC07_006593 [Ceratobasidium sp. 392]